MRSTCDGLEIHTVDDGRVETALEARQFEQLVDEPAQLIDTLSHHARGSSVRQQLAGRDDSRQWRPELVRSVCRKLSFPRDPLLERLRHLVDRAGESGDLVLPAQAHALAELAPSDPPSRRRRAAKP